MIKVSLKLKEEPGALGLVLYVLGIVGVLILNLAIGFGICALCTYVACMCFGFNWDIVFAFGVFCLMVMLWWFTQ